MINIYIDSNFKGLKGTVEYGYRLEWVRNGETVYKSDITLGEMKDTKNRVFLYVLIEALKRIQKPEALSIYAPCDYLITNMKKGRPHQWLLHSWIKGNGDEIKNKDLWTALINELKKPEILSVEWYGGTHRYSEDIIREIERKYEV